MLAEVGDPKLEGSREVCVEEVGPPCKQSAVEVGEFHCVVTIITFQFQFQV